MGQHGVGFFGKFLFIHRVLPSFVTVDPGRHLSEIPKMRQTPTVLFALCLSLTLSACGLKGPLYLSTPASAPPPATVKKEKAEPAKGGDDNKATTNKNTQESTQ
jgi:predicted small lipoprotein YifL